MKKYFLIVEKDNILQFFKCSGFFFRLKLSLTINSLQSLVFQRKHFLFWMNKIVLNSGFKKIFESRHTNISYDELIWSVYGRLLI